MNPGLKMVRRWVKLGRKVLKESYPNGPKYSKALATIVVAGLAVSTAQGGLVVFNGEEPKTKIEPKQLVFVPVKVHNMPPNADEQFSKKIRGIKLKNYIDAKVTCDLSTVAGALWNPESELYKIHGEKINAALEMFEYKIEENTEDKLVSVYKVKMHSWIGPDHADQSQIHQIIKTEDSETHHVTVKTKNYPYSETFNVLQVWEFKRLSDTQLHVKMSSGIDWIDPPMSIIRSNIESSITKGQKANAQQFSKYFTK